MDKEEWFQKFSDGYLLDSGKPGPTSVIMAGTHGNEICGVKAFYQIVPTLNIEKGKVYFVFGNPRAIEQKVRLTEFNLNRTFRTANFYTKEIKKTYEYQRAQYLKKILTKADTLLDIHSTTNPGSKPFIICSKKGHKIATFLPKMFIREVWGFGDIEPGATDDFMDSKGKIGITVECGQHDDIKAVNLAKETILSFLIIRGHNENKVKNKQNKRPVFQMQRIYKNKSASFKLKKKFVDFSPIKKGALIGFDGLHPVNSDRNGVIVFAHDTHGQNEEAFILGKRIKLT